MWSGLRNYFAQETRWEDTRNGARVQLSVIIALMLRDGMSRYGHESLGFFWVMGEPLLLTVGVMVMWSMTNQHASQIGVVPFALTGYSILTLWRHVVFKSVHGMRHAMSLVFHRNIRFFDVLFARALLETLGIFTAFALAYTPLYLLGYIMPIRDPLALCGGWLLTAWFCFGFGLVIAGLTETFEGLERFIQPAMYITLPFTGVFYMVHWLPLKAQQIMLWSPLVHSSEMFRGGLFPSDIPTYWDPYYLLFWCVLFTGIGLPLTQYAQRHVEYS